MVKEQKQSSHLPQIFLSGPDLRNLLDEIEDVFRLGRKDFIAWEIFILVALEFDLKLPEHEIYPHYHRIQNET
jgi:hypothetical protein